MYLDILHVFYTYPKRFQDTFWDTHQVHQDTCILHTLLSRAVAASSLLQPSCHTFVTDTVLLRLPMQVPRKSVDQAGRELRSARRAHCATDSARPLLHLHVKISLWSD